MWSPFLLLSMAFAVRCIWAFRWGRVLVESITVLSRSHLHFSLRSLLKPCLLAPTCSTLGPFSQFLLPFPQFLAHFSFPFCTTGRIGPVRSRRGRPCLNEHLRPAGAPAVAERGGGLGEFGNPTEGGGVHRPSIVHRQRSPTLLCWPPQPRHFWMND